MFPSVLAARRPLLAVSLLALAASAHAQNKLDTVVTTATRTPQRLSEVLTDLTVITRADIERQTSASLADLLRNNGCAEMVRNGGSAANTQMYLRGADSRHTLVLVDGMRLDSQSSGGASWQGIPLSQIERVEVLKGPASAIYGSDAVGGVVQIFTRKGSGKVSADLGIAAGNLGTLKVDGALYGSAGIVDFAMSLSAEDSDGFNATVDSVPDRDGWRRYEGSLRVGAQIASGHRAELVAMRSHANGQYDASKTRPNADDHTLQDTDAARLAWTAQWLPSLQTQLSYGESRDRYETTPSPYLTNTRIKNLALTGYYELGQGQQLTFTGERQEDKLENSSLVTSSHTADRSRNAAGLGYLLNAGPLSFQAHARHDDDSQFGGVSTGTLLAGYEVASGLRIVGSVGNAFRAPTLYQQGSTYGPLSKPGAKPLEAEQGHNVEFGLKYGSGDTEVSAAAYRNRVSNLIIFGGTGPCISTSGCYQNVSMARLQGLTLAGGTKVSIVNLRATLDLQAPKDATTGLLLARRAKRLGTLNADTALGDWVLGAGVQASGARFDNATNTRKLGGYGLLNLSAQYRISRELKLQLNVDNTFDREYQTANGYASAPRTVLVSMRWNPSL